MAVTPFMRHRYSARHRFIQVAVRWWQYGRHKKRSIDHHILWLDALLQLGMAHYSEHSAKSLLQNTLSKHQRYALQMIAATAMQHQNRAWHAIDMIQQALVNATTVAQKAELLQKEGKCRAELGHWQRAYWCFEHACLLREQIGLHEDAKRSKLAMKQLKIRQQSAQASVFGQVKNA